MKIEVWGKKQGWRSQTFLLSFKQMRTPYSLVLNENCNQSYWDNILQVGRNFISLELVKNIVCVGQRKNKFE